MLYICVFLTVQELCVCVFGFRFGDQVGAIGRLRNFIVAVLSLETFDIPMRIDQDCLIQFLGATVLFFERFLTTPWLGLPHYPWSSLVNCRRTRNQFGGRGVLALQGRLKQDAAFVLGDKNVQNRGRIHTSKRFYEKPLKLVANEQPVFWLAFFLSNFVVIISHPSLSKAPKFYQFYTISTLLPA